MSRYYRITLPARFGIRTRHADTERGAMVAAVDMYRRATGGPVISPPDDLLAKIEYQRLPGSTMSAPEWATWKLYKEPRGFQDAQP